MFIRNMALLSEALPVAQMGVGVARQLFGKADGVNT